MTEPATTIEQLQAEFTHWRSNKNGHRSIPEHLWNKAAHIKKSHPSDNVLKKLGLTTQQARKKGIIESKKREHDCSKERLSNQFIKIPTNQSTTHSIATDVTITSKNGDYQLSLKNASIEHLQLIIDKFLR